MDISDKSNVRPEIPDNVTPSVYFNTLVINRINKCPTPKITSMNLLVEFCISGENGGRWGLVIEKGMAKEIMRAKDSDSEPYPQKPNCSFTMNGDTFLAIVRKEITPQKAFFKKKVDIRGNIFLALKANALVCYL
ncbi:MAG: SCP2 sterol-binding domain-containing protein [Candidatus Anammoxibacter sp.]